MTYANCGEKWCPVCRRRLPASPEFFHRNRQKPGKGSKNPDGLRSKCKECRNRMRSEERFAAMPTTVWDKIRRASRWGTGVRLSYEDVEILMREVV